MNGQRRRLSLGSRVRAHARVGGDGQFVFCGRLSGDSSIEKSRDRTEAVIENVYKREQTHLVNERLWSGETKRAANQRANKGGLGEEEKQTARGNGNEMKENPVSGGWGQLLVGLGGKRWFARLGTEYGVV